jgi:hypothetical protein
MTSGWISVAYCEAMGYLGEGLSTPPREPIDALNHRGSGVYPDIDLSGDYHRIWRRLLRSPLVVIHSVLVDEWDDDCLLE